MCSLTSKLLQLTRNVNKLRVNRTQIRLSSYNSSPLVKDIQDQNVQYDVTRDANDWKYVERLLKPLVVPEPTIKESYVCGWKPQTQDLTDRPYFVARTKNHMMPVFLHISQRGYRKITVVKKIEGDIWLLEKELQEFLRKYQSRKMSFQVNEFVGYIRIHGDHVNAVKYYLEKKGY